MLLAASDHGHAVAAAQNQHSLPNGLETAGFLETFPRGVANASRGCFHLRYWLAFWRTPSSSTLPLETLSRWRDRPGRTFSRSNGVCQCRLMQLFFAIPLPV